MKKPKKLVVFVEFIYVLVKCSVYFWGWLVKEGVIYGWVRAQRKLLLCVDQPEAQQEKLSTLTKSVEPEKLWGKTLSASLFLAFALFGSGFWLASTQLGLFLMVVGSLFSVFFLIFITNYTLSDPTQADEISVETNYQILRQTVRPNLWNLFIGFTYLFWLLLLPISPLLFFFVAPGGVAYLLKKGQQKYYEMKGNPYDYRQS